MSQDNNKEEDKKDKKNVRVSDKLKDFDIKINSFGQIISSYDVDKINDYLNENVDDKKLNNRKDEIEDKYKTKEDRRKRKKGDNEEEE